MVLFACSIHAAYKNLQTQLTLNFLQYSNTNSLRWAFLHNEYFLAILAL